MSTAIYKKMIEVMKDIGAIGKDQKNQAQNFAFRGIDQFINALHPALSRAGVFMAPRVMGEKMEIKEVTRNNGKQGLDKHVHLMVEYDFIAEDGSKVTVGPVASEGLDSGDKATSKAMSAALKYALIQTFSIPTADVEDADRSSPELLPTQSGLPQRAQAIPKTVPPPPSENPFAAAEQFLDAAVIAQEDDTPRYPFEKPAWKVGKIASELTDLQIKSDLEYFRKSPPRGDKVQKWAASVAAEWAKREGAQSSVPF